MAPCLRLEVMISTGNLTRPCTALINADCWPQLGVPGEIAGSLDLPKSEWQEIAEADRLVLTLRDSGEPYRMIFDSSNGRFFARQL